METNQTIDKVEFIRENIDKQTWVQMSKVLGVNERYLRKLATKNDIHKNRKGLTKEDFDYIRQHVNEKTWIKLAKKIGYSQNALIEACKRQGIVKSNNKKFTRANADYLTKNINLKSWPELAKAIGYSETYLKEYCKTHGIVKQAWAHDKIKRRIETTRTFNKSWVIEGGGKDSKTRWLLQKWKNINGPLPKRHILMFENKLGTFEDLVLIHKKSYSSFLRHRNARLKEKDWAVSHAIDKPEHKTTPMNKLADMEKAFGRVPVNVNHKTIKFVDINKCERDIFGKWKLKQQQND